MMLFTKGNILHSQCEALVNPVNCQGAMGAGLALAFAKKFGTSLVKQYKEACDVGKIRPGHPHVVFLDPNEFYRKPQSVVICFPTKDDWRNPSQLEWIDSGLENMAKELVGRDIKSVAVPRLGCGLGGLDWKDVLPLIVKHLSGIRCAVVVYE